MIDIEGSVSAHNMSIALRLSLATDRCIKRFFNRLLFSSSDRQTIKAFLPEMLTSSRNPNQKGYGHIVSIASIAGLSGSVRLTDYCASKFAAVGLEEALRLELQCDGYNGIHSTVVCPFFINTGMFSGVDSR